MIEQIKKSEDLKASLQKLRQELKGIRPGELPKQWRAEYPLFVEFLSDDDPKVRQNAVLIIKELAGPELAGEEKPSCDSEVARAVYDAYLKDPTKYNKEAYLSALNSFDLQACGLAEKLMERRAALIAAEYAPEDKKHIINELHELSLLLRPFLSAHTFSGSNMCSELVLLTNRNFKKLTMDRLKNISHKEFTAGVMVKTTDIEHIRKNIRTYSEFLFVPEGVKTCSSDPVEAAEALIAGGLPKYIQSRITEPDSPVFFRVERRGKDTKACVAFEKKLASELEYLSGWSMVNSVSEYEVELRFVETADNKLIVLVKFCNLPDERFSYRKMSLPVSIKPYIAATVMNLAQPYLSEEATVLDPFCGCGTMLIEREKIIPASRYYGIDIFGDAIEAAKTNLKEAGLMEKTELIKKDFFLFTHKYRFDEVVTDMPFVTDKKSSAEIERLYRDFFRKIPSLLESGARLFIYSRNRDVLRKYAGASGFRIISEFEISKAEGSWFCILSL